MKYLATNDWHFAKQNPTSRKDDYNGELCELLTQVLQIVRVLKVDVVGVAGDLFHNKGLAPWSVVVWLLRWAQQVREAGAEILTISGNHDQQHDRYESLDQTPYGALVSSGLFTDISRRRWEVKGVRFMGVPWPDGSKPDAFDTVQDTDVVLAHGFATVEGIERWGVHCHKYDDLARVAPRVRLWHFGHDHTDHGVYQLPGGYGQVINVGALARGALDQDSLVRSVKVALADIDPNGPLTVQQITLKQRPADEIFDLDRHKARVRERQHLDQFLQGLQTGLDSVIDVDYVKVLAGLPLDGAVRQRVEEYIHRAEAVAAS